MQLQKTASTLRSVPAGTKEMSGVVRDGVEGRLPRAPQAGQRRTAFRQPQGKILRYTPNLAALDRRGWCPFATTPNRGAHFQIISDSSLDNGRKTNDLSDLCVDRGQTDVSIDFLPGLKSAFRAREGSPQLVIGFSKRNKTFAVFFATCRFRIK